MPEKKEILLTDSQAQAIGSQSRKTIVSAGAGTGKTLVLVERFVRLVLKQNIRVDEILAITFTDKAAAEMKVRIAARLLERGQLDQHRQEVDIFSQNPQNYWESPEFKCKLSESQKNDLKENMKKELESEFGDISLEDAVVMSEDDSEDEDMMKSLVNETQSMRVRRSIRIFLKDDK